MEKQNDEKGIMMVLSTLLMDCFLAISVEAKSIEKDTYRICKNEIFIDYDQLNCKKIVTEVKDDGAFIVVDLGEWLEEQDVYDIFVIEDLNTPPLPQKHKTQNINHKDAKHKPQGRKPQNISHKNTSNKDTTNMSKHHISWENIQEWSADIAHKIAADCPDINHMTLVAVSRGGLDFRFNSEHLCI